jgi:hypothetical protein
MTIDWLGMAARPRAPRPELKAHVLARALAASRSRRPLLPLAPAAPHHLLIGAGALAGARAVARARGERDALAAQLLAARDTLDFLRRPGARVYHIPLAPAGLAGTVTIFADSATHRWLVACHDMTPNAPGEAYQVWFLTERGPVSALVMAMHDTAPMLATVAMPAAAVAGVAMSVEPEAGSGELRGPTVFRMTL